MILTADYFGDDDVVTLARDLLGKKIVSRSGNHLTSGIIVETEAYSGASDRASHAFPNKITPRTKVMFGPPGVAYVYLCYGIHHLFNIVVSQPGTANAILVRALEPLEGLEVMRQRRNSHQLTNGPGKLSSALAITTADNKTSLVDNASTIQIHSHTTYHDIVVSKRVGVEYAKEDALLPWRFYVRNNKWVSKFD